jgi:hypothetical protein
MKLSVLKRHLTREPFRAYELETFGGNHIAVNRAEDIHISSYEPYLIVIFDGDGTYTVIEPDYVLSIHGT